MQTDFDFNWGPLSCSADWQTTRERPPRPQLWRSKSNGCSRNSGDTLKSTKRLRFALMTSAHCWHIYLVICQCGILVYECLKHLHYLDGAWRSADSKTLIIGQMSLHTASSKENLLKSHFNGCDETGWKKFISTTVSIFNGLTTKCPHWVWVKTNGAKKHLQDLYSTDAN